MGADCKERWKREKLSSGEVEVGKIRSLGQTKGWIPYMLERRNMEANL